MEGGKESGKRRRGSEGGEGRERSQLLLCRSTRRKNSTDLRSRDGKREVDELKSEGNLPVLVRNGVLLFVGEVLSAEDSKRCLHVEVSDGEHVAEGGEE